METHATQLPLYRLFEVGSFSSPRDVLKSLGSRLEVLPPALLKALDAQLSAVLYNFDIAVADWLVFPASAVVVGQYLVEIGQTVATALDEIEVVELEDMLLVFLDDESEVLYLTLDLLGLCLWAADLVYRYQWRRSVTLAVVICKIELPLRPLN